MRYSQPRPTGGAIVAIESKVSAPVAHGLEARLHPHPLLGGAGAGEVGVELVLLDLLQAGRGVVDRGPVRSRLVQSTSSATFSATGTSNGSMSYDETQLTSS